MSPRFFSIARGHTSRWNRAVTRRPGWIVISGIVLAFLGVVLWQCRFERSGPALDLGIHPDFRGWEMKHPERIRHEDGAWVLPHALGNTDFAGAEAGLKGWEDQRFLHVSVDVAWDDVGRGNSWHSAKVTLAGKGADGRYIWPEDSDVVNAGGTRGWHHVECVLDLPAGLGEPRLFIWSHATQGTLRVRNFTVTPVVQRPWIPLATVVLVASWLAWALVLFAAVKSPGRRLLAAAGWVVAAWYLVFPQPQMHVRSFPTGFFLGAEIPPPSEPPPPVMVPTSDRVPPPAAPEALPGPPPAPPAATPPPAPAPPAAVVEDGKSDHALATAIRHVVHFHHFAHLVVFTAASLLIFLVAGLRAGMVPALLLATCSEVFSNLQRQDFGWDDVVDLLGNVAGVLLAAAFVKLVAGWIRNRRQPRPAPGIT